MRTRTDEGSVTLEGLAAMLVFFILLTIIVQVGFLVVARTSAAGALEAAVRRGSDATTDLRVVESRLMRDLNATVPGTADADVSLSSDGRTVTGTVSFEWAPPGPDLVPITISLTRQSPVVVPP